MQLTIFTLC